MNQYEFDRFLSGLDKYMSKQPEYAEECKGYKDSLKKIEDLKLSTLSKSMLGYLDMEKDLVARNTAGDFIYDFIPPTEFLIQKTSYDAVLKSISAKYIPGKLVAALTFVRGEKMTMDSYGQVIGEILYKQVSRPDEYMKELEEDIRQLSLSIEEKKKEKDEKIKHELKVTTGSKPSSKRERHRQKIEAASLRKCQ